MCGGGGDASLHLGAVKSVGVLMPRKLHRRQKKLEAAALATLRRYCHLLQPRKPRFQDVAPEGVSRRLPIPAAREAKVVKIVLGNRRERASHFGGKR